MNFEIENSKQAEYLNNIRNVGMRIVTQEVIKDEVFDVFNEYNDYISESKSYNKLVIELNRKVNNKEIINPDDLFIPLMKYFRQIEYEDEIEDEYENEYKDEDEDLIEI